MFSDARHILYLSCPTPINPVISLSNTWKPRQYSSGSPGSRKPPGRLRTLWKESKSTFLREPCQLNCFLQEHAIRAGVRLVLLTVSTHALLEVVDLGQGRVLAAGA